MPDRSPIRSYAEFWPYYLRQHAKSSTRAWHMLGTLLAAILLAGAFARLDAKLFLAALVAGYGPAWMAHSLVEKNRPATFRYPLWSLVSDVRMTATWIAGGLERELKKAGVGAQIPLDG